MASFEEAPRPRTNGGGQGRELAEESVTDLPRPKLISDLDRRRFGQKAISDIVRTPCSQSSQEGLAACVTCDRKPLVAVTRYASAIAMRLQRPSKESPAVSVSRAVKPAGTDVSDTTVVIPCYNEAKRLDVTEFSHFIRQVPNVQFVFVNDGSTDDTLDVLEALRQRQSAPSQVAILNLPQNVGKAEAVRRGFLEAFSAWPDYVAFWDADLATPLGAIPLFRAVFDRYPGIQVVIGTRVPLLGHHIRRQPLRRLLGCLFSKLASWSLGISIRDTQCGAKMFRVTAEIESLFLEPFTSRWIFDVELLARLIRGQRASGSSPVQDVIFEYPLEIWEDVDGSKLRTADLARCAVELAEICYTYRFGHQRSRSRARPRNP